MSSILEKEVRTPFRVLAMLVAVLGVFGMIGLGWAAFADSWEWSLAALVVAPFVCLMAHVAIKGHASSLFVQNLFGLFHEQP